MILQGLFKLTEAKCIVSKDTIGRYEYRIHDSCDTWSGSPNETSRHKWFVPSRYLGGNDEQKKPIVLYSAKQVF